MSGSLLNWIYPFSCDYHVATTSFVSEAEHLKVANRTILRRSATRPSLLHTVCFQYREARGGSRAVRHVAQYLGRKRCALNLVTGRRVRNKGRVGTERVVKLVEVNAATSAFVINLLFGL